MIPLRPSSLVRAAAQRLAPRLPWLYDLKDAWLASRTRAFAVERAARDTLERLRLVPDGSLYPRLGAYGRKIHSQNDEDGVLAYLFSRLAPASPSPSGERFFVEIGVGPPLRPGRAAADPHALECNSLALQRRGWRGLFLDGHAYPAELGVTQAFVTAENINDLLAQHGAPPRFDLFSLDIDGNDYWVWRALRAEPTVVIVEYNASLGPRESKTIPYDPRFDWSANGCTQYYGASLLALTRLGAEKGYTLVYANGVNAFFVRSERVPNRDQFRFERLYRHNPAHAPLRGDERWHEVT